MKRTLFALSLFTLIFISANDAFAELRAGAAVTNVTPPQFPVLVNGGMLSRSVSEVSTPVNARAIVLDDGKERIAIVVVDSCMMPRPLLDEAKQLASQRTKIKPDRMLISATHTHTAPSCMGALGTNADLTYVPFLREKLAQAIVAAEKNLEPARVGWAVGNAAEYTALRRWIRRPDRMAKDPFGNLTVRANMHAANKWDDVTGESGPEDPDLNLISFQSKDGRPIAVLANFSMHYFSGERGISADYFGLFSDGFKSRIAKDSNGNHPPFVGIMSHGCSGDIWRRDYRIPPEERPNPKIEEYADGLLDIAQRIYDTIQYDEDADLAMAEARLHLKYRVPDTQRLEWAQRIVDEMGDSPPKTGDQVYALEQIILHERQSTDIVVQGLRIGDIGITTTPNETYALTALKLKLQSPLKNTMVIELANGGDGYIPPPEQHFLGGYNTWAARSAGLEIQAEPKIVESALQLLEKAAGKPRREFQQSRGPTSQAILAAKPVAYWRLDEFGGLHASDSSGQHRDAIYEMGVAYFLDGPKSKAFCADDDQNRAVHFAGGRMRSQIADLGNQYSVSLWMWNGMPVEGREVTGWMLSRGHDNGLGSNGDHLGLGGTASQPGKLIFLKGDTNPLVGQTEIDRWTWNHVVFVRDGDSVKVHLNGNAKPEIEANSDAPANCDQLFFGGRCDNNSNWEGRLDEIAVFDRALSGKEIKILAGQ